METLTIGITIQKTFGSGFMCGLFVGAIVTLIFLYIMDTTSRYL